MSPVFSEALEWPILDFPGEVDQTPTLSQDRPSESIPGGLNTPERFQLPEFPQLENSGEVLPEYPEYQHEESTVDMVDKLEFPDWNLPELPHVDMPEQPRPDISEYPEIHRDEAVFPENMNVPEHESPTFPESPEVQPENEGTPDNMERLVAAIESRAGPEQYGGSKSPFLVDPVEAIQTGSWKSPISFPPNGFPASPSIG
jgi:hypothetical protein